jgi:hypothetical protein
MIPTICEHDPTIFCSEVPMGLQWGTLEIENIRNHWIQVFPPLFMICPCRVLVFALVVAFHKVLVLEQ